MLPALLLSNPTPFKKTSSQRLAEQAGLAEHGTGHDEIMVFFQLLIIIRPDFLSRPACVEGTRSPCWAGLASAQAAAFPAGRPGRSGIFLRSRPLPNREADLGALAVPPELFVSGPESRFSLLNAEALDISKQGGGRFLKTFLRRSVAL